jgi:hypothetical protein
MTGLSQWGGVHDNRVKSAGAEDGVMSMGSTGTQGMVKITGCGGHCVKKGFRRQR